MTTATPQQDQAEKARENRLRRMAARQGFVLQKSRRRDPRALDFGEYQILDAGTGAIVLADHNRGYGCDLNEVESYLLEEPS